MKFIIFLKSQEITEVNAKLSQNAYELSKLVNFWIEFDEENWKKYRIMSSLYEIYDCHAIVKNDEHSVDISKFSRRIKEELLEVSAP